ALASPLLGKLSLEHPEEKGSLDVGGRRYLVTFRMLHDTQGWLVGIVVPEDHYTGEIRRTEARSLSIYLAVTAFMVAGGALALRSIRRDLGRLSHSTARMRAFDFAPSDGSARAFRDIDDVSESLERAKTVVRAMGKYLPMDLVRRL